MIHQAYAYPEYSQPLTEAWGDVVDIRREQQDEWQQLGWGGSIAYSTGRPDDRLAGRCRPIFETEQDLDDIRAISRWVADCTPQGISATLNLTNYVIGKGFGYKCQPVKGTNDTATVDEVQACIDEFLERNRWALHREREIFRTSIRDGESLLKERDEAGYTSISVVDVARIRQPKELPEYGESWSFGIATDADDLCEARGFFLQWDDLVAELELLPGEQAHWLKRNTDSGVKRGISDFFSINTDISRVRKMLGSMVASGGVQAAIAMIVEHATGVTGAQVEALVQQNATMRSSERTAAGGTRTRYQTDERGGTRLDVGKGQTYKGSPLANSEAANAFVAILQAGLRSIGTRWAMPEYMISGDASNANYNSSKEAGTPFVKNAEAEQAIYTDHYRRLMWRVVSNACKAGRIRKPIEEVRRLVDLQVEPPAVVIRDPDKETTRRGVLYDKGILSAKTWAAQEGLDFDQELQNGAQRQQIIMPSAPTLESIAAWRGYP